MMARKLPQTNGSATWLGLALALIGPGLVAFLSKPAAGQPIALPTSLFWLAIFIGLVAIVAMIAFRAEKLDWGDVGFRRLSWPMLALAIVLALFFIFVFGPIAAWALVKSGLAGFDAGANFLAALPLWYRCLVILVVAGGEEWLYRGYAIERLASLTGNVKIAGPISLIAFALAHLPIWGIGVATTTFVAGGVFTILYIWRRNVAPLILAHVFVDLYGLAITQ